MAAGLGFIEFATGDILTAAAANGYLASQTVMVFASAAARTSAITSPQEGMFSYLKDTNATEYYTGSAWVALGGGASGLTLIKTQTIGSAVSSVSVTDIFSSTYDNYLIKLSGGASSTGTNIAMRLGTTSTGYYVAGFYIEYGSSTLTGESVQNHSSFYAMGVGETSNLNGECEIFCPNLAKNTHVLYRSSASSTAGPYKNYGGYLADTTQYTGVTIFPSSGTLTGGTIKVYGYQNS
jgi:hypothetical protein